MNWYKYRIIYRTKTSKYYIQRRHILWFKWTWFYHNDDYHVTFISHRETDRTPYSCKEAHTFHTVDEAKERLEHILKPLKKELVVVFPEQPKELEIISKRKIKV